jgi:hypothetical protein
MLVIGRKPVFLGQLNIPRNGAASAALLNKLGHGVWIGPDIRVRVLEYNNGMVRIGIDAPRDVEILRDELGTP